MTGLYSIEIMTTEQVIDNWGKLAPMMEASVIGNSISATDMTAGYVLERVLADEAVVFAGRVNGNIEMVLVLQFSVANEYKCADLIALAGRNITKFKALYWEAILEWLRQSGVRFLDTLVPEERAKMYLTKFGFDRSCTMLRKELLNG